jgi:hypothetical protein
MRVDITKITSSIRKISDLTSGDKTVPGVLLDLSEGLLKVCYSDGHKSFVEHLSVETEETDKIGAVAVDFEQIKRAIDNCQPSGRIKVSEVTFEYKEKVITVSVNQKFEIIDDSGAVAEERTLGKKAMDIAWNEPGSNMRSAILTRMKYDEIFDSEMPDEFNRSEFLDALNKTAAEKGKQIYLSTKNQTIFVINQAHVTSVPVSKRCEIDLNRMDEIRAELTESAEGFSEQAFQTRIAAEENRMHYAVVMPQQIAKAITGVFGKTSADNMYLHTKEKFCSIYVDTDDEHVGIWFEMAQASRSHIGSLERYNSLGYKTYQLKFLRDFLVDNIKSAVNVNKGNQVAFTFDRNEDGKVELVVAAGSSAASVSDTYRVVVDSANWIPESEQGGVADITAKVFNVSLAVFSAMLDQLKSDFIALDFNIGEDGTTCIRLAEIDNTKEKNEYIKARKKTEELCKSQGIEFDPGKTPTPVQLRLDYRNDILATKQFTLLAK